MLVFALMIFLGGLLPYQHVRAEWTDFLNILKKDTSASVNPVLSDTDIIGGLKQALSKGTKTAVAFLGREDGFLANPDVKIHMPDNLRKVERSLRKAGQDKIVDEFIASMNHAAERAVPEAAAVFLDAIRDMSVADANQILGGADNAATEYFRANSNDRLYEKFHPLVQQATERASVTAKYKKLTGKLGPLASVIDTSRLDLDDYITRKTLDGLFYMVADEEKKIRENPAARTTELLKKVFGRE